VKWVVLYGKRSEWCRSVAKTVMMKKRGKKEGIETKVDVIYSKARKKKLKLWKWGIDRLSSIRSKKQSIAKPCSCSPQHTPQISENMI
jgi:hypothetical protein